MDCNNLIVAGKTISSESQAVGGFRCMPSSMAIGQAAEAACALSNKHNVSLSDISVEELQKSLKNHGAIID